GMISLAANELREGTSQVIPCSQTIKDVVEVIARLPAQFRSRAVVHVDSSDAGKHFPASALIFGFIVGNALPHYSCCVSPQAHHVIREEGCGCADNIFAKSDG